MICKISGLTSTLIVILMGMASGCRTSSANAVDGILVERLKQDYLEFHNRIHSNYLLGIQSIQLQKMIDIPNSRDLYLVYHELGGDARSTRRHFEALYLADLESGFERLIYNHFFDSRDHQLYSDGLIDDRYLLFIAYTGIGTGYIAVFVVDLQFELADIPGRASVMVWRTPVLHGASYRLVDGTLIEQIGAEEKKIIRVEINPLFSENMLVPEFVVPPLFVNRTQAP